MVNPASVASPFITQECMKHLVIDNIGYNVFRNVGAVEPSIDDNRIMSRIEVPKGDPIRFLAPADVSDLQPILEIGLVEFSV